MEGGPSEDTEKMPMYKIKKPSEGTNSANILISDFCPPKLLRQ